MDCARQVGFQRFQINATAANGVDTRSFATAEGARRCVAALRLAFGSLPSVEFIVQTNSETKPLWSLLREQMPPNASLLFDESMGLGKSRQPPDPTPVAYRRPSLWPRSSLTACALLTSM